MTQNKIDCAAVTEGFINKENKMHLTSEELRSLIYQILCHNPHGKDPEVAIELTVAIFAEEIKRELQS